MSEPPQTSSFVQAAEFFLISCPGPALAQRGLRLAAFQPVKGIPGLVMPESSAPGRQAPPKKYFRSMVDVAAKLHLRPEYLSDSALKRGWSYSRALRWIRFLHGTALRREGVAADSIAWRLAFADIAGWSRFTERLTGRTLGKLPSASLDYWAWKAVDDTFLGLSLLGLGKNMGNDNQAP